LDEMGCIWMNAGILSYRLCDREFECDTCALHAALRMQSSPPLEERGNSLCASSAVPEVLRDNRLYSSNHCWSMKIGPGMMRIGIEPGLGMALLAPRAIVFPAAGQNLRSGQTCLWVVTEGGTLPVESPVNGTVRHANPLLVEAPHLLNQDPFDRGWLLDVETDPADGESNDLLTADQAAPRYAEARNRLSSLISKAIHGNRPQVGITLADGGQYLQNIADILGPCKYFSFVRRVYR
jgi:glycine cleavage system H protein